jgi:formate/nitrite transporter FocA (FNT family)
MSEAREQDAERKEAEERSAPSGRIVYKAIMKEGEEELKRPSSALFWSGLAAGLSMGFSMIAEGLLHAYLPEAEWRPLVAKFGYSVGFLIVILGRQQLFTENTLTPALPFLRRKAAGTLGNVARLWAVVLLANIIAGAVEVFALAAAGQASWPSVLGGYVAPTLIGNVLGGVTLVATLNHAQVVAGGGGEDV